MSSGQFQFRHVPAVRAEIQAEKPVKHRLGSGLVNQKGESRQKAGSSPFSHHTPRQMASNVQGDVR
jgi:hypothetical protein